MNISIDRRSWSFAEIWNRSLESREERPLIKRDRMWASELGGSFVDRYLKMNAIPFSNPYDPRSLRKFEAGRIFEWIVEMVLVRAGILISKQDWIPYQYPNLLMVTGKLDHLAGGTPDYEKAKATIEHTAFPEFIKTAAVAVVESLAEQHPNGLNHVILEIKSVGSLMFHRYDTYKIADDKHVLQLFHYLKGTDSPEGHIVYISKDDLCLAEIGVFKDTERLETTYHKDIERMTHYIKNKEMPPKEPEITFDENTGHFASNWKIAYSPYLTKVYGFKNQAEFDEKNKPIATRWNRVVGRYKEGKDLTKNNLSAIEEMRLVFPNIEELLEIAKKAKVTEEETNYES
jgi:hypothetical protein